MRLKIWSFAAALFLVGCTSAPPEVAIINDAASSLGGAEQIQAVRTLIIEGTGENTNLGQSLSPDNLQTFTVNEFRRSIDFEAGRARLQQTRTATFGVNPAPQTQNFAVDGDIAYNVTPNGVTRANQQAARDRRMEIYHHPIGALREALAEGAQVLNARRDGIDDVVDVMTASGDRFTLYVDSSTKLPSKVISMTANDNNWPLGDVMVETSFADYAEADGLNLPGRITTRTDRYVTADIRVSANLVNADVADLAAPEDVRSAAVAGIPTPTVTVEAVSEGLWYLTGQSHHSVLVEFEDHLTLIEAPQNEVRTGAVIERVKEIKPDKPLRYVVNTHHHFDHSGGIRRAMAEEGVTIITHEGNRAFFEEIGQRTATIYPDMLGQSPRTPTVIGVSDKYELTDGTRTVEIYHIPNPHSDTMLMVYLPAERILIQADLYSPPAVGAQPPPAGFPNAPSIIETVQRLGLRVDRLMPIHGRIVPYRDLEAAVRGQVSS